jgi:PAS domain S-box-containing protein
VRHRVTRCRRDRSLSSDVLLRPHATVEGIVFHRDGLITDLNAPMAALIGGTREQLLGRHVMEFVSPPQVARVQQVMAQGAELSYETEIVDLAGRPIAVEFIVRTLVRGGEKLRMTIVRDIRDRQAAQARIRQLAHHDTLTGLHNRGAFVERLEAELAHPSAPGIALFPEHGRDADSLLRHADAALYAGKAAGRDAVTVFEPSMGEAIDAEMQLETELRRGEFALVFEPWFERDIAECAPPRPAAHAGRVVWHHPRRGLLQAPAFTQPGVSMRLLQQVAEWALREATLRRAAGALGPDAGIVLDTAGLQLGSATLLALASSLPAAEATAGPLWFTLAERQAADESTVLPHVLAQLQQRGIGVLLSDFGTGGLGLSRLRELPLAGWCLDRALLHTLPDDAGAAAIVQAQITLAEGLGRVAVARPVVKDAQRRWLAAAGCHWLGGPALSQPAPDAAGRDVVAAD